METGDPHIHPINYRIQVPDGMGGDRLDRFLASQEVGLSRSRIKSLIKDGMVEVNGATIRQPSHRLCGGEDVLVAVPPPEPLELRPCPVPFSVLYEDSHLVVVDKPAGLVVHPGAGREEKTLVHGLLYRCSDLSGIGGVLRPGIVHRLDRDTSGVMVVAKSDEAHEGLVRAFKGREVSKVYMALVRGTMDAIEGEIHRPIGRHPVHRKRMAVDGSGARDATTLWRVREELPGTTLLSVRILTGRTHQIRCHMASIGHPILGDSLYGGPKRLSLPGGAVDVPRQILHSFRLSFRHPITHEEMVFEAPLPKDFLSILNGLREGSGR